jgi:halimadienyl-diphosphate synthase
LDTPKNLFYDGSSVEKKLQILNSSPHLWRKSSMSFSLEAVRSCFPDNPDFLESNGSVGTSPAATAALLLRINSKENCTEALEYLQNVVLRQSDGGTPDVSPIDTFETAWSLNYLRLAGAISPNNPQVKHVLDWLWSVWSPDRGIGFSSQYSLPNSDDSAVTFAMLDWAGYNVKPSVFGFYEEIDHFRCFPGELNPSLSANLRLIAALRRFSDSTAQAWISKALLMVQERWVNGECWWDKWHCSPFYLTCIVVHSLAGMPERLESIHETRVSISRIVSSYVQWLVNSQYTDGGWGYYGWSTLEESSYAMLALLHALDHGIDVDPSVLLAGGKYILEHFEERYSTSLWIGKCLYSPKNVVEAVRLSACWKYLQWERNYL